MKNCILIIFFISLSLRLLGQSKIYGLYIAHSFGTINLDLKVDQTYRLTFFPACNHLADSVVDFGKYTVRKDTVNTVSSIRNTLNMMKKYLIVHYDSVIVLKEIFNHIETRNDLAVKNSKDPQTLFTTFVRHKFYFDNGKTYKSWWSEGKKTTVEYFYLSGKIEHIETYFKNKKSGHWIYYYENGRKRSAVTYRRNRIRKITSS